MTIAIVTDSSCDLPAEIADRHNIEIVPLTIRFGDESFVDREQLSSDDFWAKAAATPELPETAAPSAGAFEQAFRRAADAGAEGVVCINISSKLSATYQSAKIAADALEGEIDVRVVDSLSVSMGLGLIVEAAAKAAELGKGVDDVANVAADLVPRTKVIAALDTLENLKKGGRIGSAQAMIGSLLSFKPIIEVQEGEVVPGSRQRTRQRSLVHLLDRLAEHGDVERIAVVHGQAPDLEPFVERVAENVDRDRIVIADLGPVVGTHAGPGVMGLGFIVGS